MVARTVVWPWSSPGSALFPLLLLLPSRLLPALSAAREVLMGFVLVVTLLLLFLFVSSWQLPASTKLRAAALLVRLAARGSGGNRCSWWAERRPRSSVADPRAAAAAVAALPEVVGRRRCRRGRCMSVPVVSSSSRMPAPSPPGTVSCRFSCKPASDFALRLMLAPAAAVAV